MSLKDDITSIKFNVLELLKDKEKIEFNEAELYFLKSEDFLKIYEIYKDAKKIFNDSNEKRKSSDPFFQVAKLFGDDKTSIIAYKFFLKHKYKNITDKKKIEDRIDALHLIEINKIKKNHEDYIAENKDSFDAAFIQNLKNELEEDIQEIKDKKKFLIDNFDDLEIKISTFKEFKEYPTIKTINTNQVDSVEHLRIEVPNVIHAHTNIFLLDEDMRKDAKHIKFILEAKKAFADIYYKKRD